MIVTLLCYHSGVMAQSVEGLTPSRVLFCGKLGQVIHIHLWANSIIWYWT